MLFLDEERTVKEHALFQLLLKPLSQLQAEATALKRKVGPALADKAELKVRHVWLKSEAARSPPKAENPAAWL